MLKIADRYFLGCYVKTLFNALLSFIIIYIVVDLIGFLDLFIDKNTPINTIILYYWYYLPFIIVLVFPIAMLMASLITTGQFVRFMELTALKSAGMSLYRIFLPVLVFALLISVFSFWFSESILPDTQRKKAELKRYEIDKSSRKYSLSKSNIFLQESNGRLVTIASYDGVERTAFKITVQIRDKNRIVKHINAAAMVPVEGAWELRKVIVRDFSGGSEVYSEQEKMLISNFSFKTGDLERVQIKPGEMNIFELSAYIEKLKQIGSPYGRWLVDYFHKMSFPFANFIVVLLGLPLATRSWRGGTAVGFGLCLGVCFVYYFVMSFSNGLGYKGVIPPHIAPWISNTVFGALGIFSLVTAKK